MTNDRILQEARGAIVTLADEVLDCGFDDLGELRLKLSGIEDVCRELRARAAKVAEEQAERMDPEPYGAGWVPDFNAWRRS